MITPDTRTASQGILAIEEMFQNPDPAGLTIDSELCEILAEALREIRELVVLMESLFEPTVDDPLCIPAPARWSQQERRQIVRQAWQEPDGNVFRLPVPTSLPFLPTDGDAA